MFKLSKINYFITMFIILVHPILSIKYFSLTLFKRRNPAKRILYLYSLQALLKRKMLFCFLNRKTVVIYFYYAIKAKIKI